MGLLDYIFKGRKPKDPKQEKPVRNNLLPAILDKWSYKRELSSGEDYSQFLRAFRSLVYTAVIKNATSVASAPLRLYVSTPSKNTKTRFPTKKIDSITKEHLLSKSHILNIPTVRKSFDIEEVQEHVILELLQRVNGWTTTCELFETTQSYLELCGDAYWYLPKNKLGLPQEIWQMSPDKVKIIPDPTNFISGYTYGSSFDNIKFKPDEIIHFRMPSVTSAYYGTSPLSAIRSEYNLLQSIYEFEVSSFENSGKPEGYWKASESLSDEDFSRLKTEIQQAWGGIKRAGASALVDNDLEYKAISLSPREMSHLEGKNSLRQDILNAFGLNLALFESTATRANAEAALLFYMLQTITPRLHRLEQKLNETLVPMFDPSLFLSFDNIIPQNEEMEIKRRESNIRLGVTCVNEERHKMRMPPVEFGDERFMQIQYAPISVLATGEHLNNNNSTQNNTNNDEK